jgi:alpha-beta hydrolase superfamily lysophospholipase
VKKDEREQGGLFVREWIPERPRGVLLLLHGFGEHGGRHLGNAAFFAEKGLVVLAFDLPGHGRSRGRRAHIDAFARYHESLDQIRSEVGERHRGLPLFLLGHSFGGLVVLDSVLAGRGAGIRGAILSSPLLAVHPDTRPGVALASLARLLSVAAPSLPFPNGIDPRHLSRDPRVVEAYRADPLVSHTASPRWFTETEAAMERVRSGAGRLALPLLILYSGADRIVDSEATRAFLEAARARGIRYPQLSHEILNEPEHAQVREDAWAWLEERLGPASP